jgi:hypothetical protein
MPLCPARIESHSGYGWLQIYPFFEHLVKKKQKIFGGEFALFHTRYFWTHFKEILNWRGLREMVPAKF